MRGKYNTVDNAVKQYPALKQTVTLAKEFNVNIVQHFGQLTKRGKICCHWWIVARKNDNNTVELEPERNQVLLGMLKNFKHIKTKHEKEISKEATQTTI